MPKAKVTKKWYAISCESNTEGRVKAEVKRRAKIEGLDHLLGRILTPTEKVSEKRNTDTGTKNVTKYVKKFPGYLVVFCHYCEEVFHLFNDLKDRGFYGFLPLDAEPIALAGPEVQHILNLQAKCAEQTTKKVVLNYKVGDSVVITKGSFRDLQGVVKSIQGTELEPTITVSVKIFGRETDIPQIPYNQVKKS